ncbi:hypothetical protein Drose_05635 [Dactylosporangium roseum]|uniref:Uncharacterized protein n=1 Tax=Dactylosporangium roseum TaxID=47989 RepID=A0ABY5Z6U2_9ACTN|nr:hypothetical protein [Dactylosporangium roseum]UWZ37751.1 hypothetical protein Drose_05635 [Dactylosporangium roseum]
MTGPDAYQRELARVVGEAARRHRERLDELAAVMPVGATLCVHDEPSSSDGCAFTIRAKVHVLAAGEGCDEPVRRAQYGPMTAEIQAQMIREAPNVDG